MKNAFDKLILILDTAKERISELEQKKRKKTNTAAEYPRTVGQLHEV